MTNVESWNLLVEANRSMQSSIDLINRALELIGEDQPAPPDSSDLPPEQIRLTGKVGRPSFQTKKEIAIWEAGLQIFNDNGEKEWINVQAWRKTAFFAWDNFPSASVIAAVGKWKHEKWSDERGNHDWDVFVITYFEDQE